MLKKLFFTLPLLLLFACGADEEPNPVPPETSGYEGYSLEWAEEFDGNSINPLNWTYELGDGTAYGLPPGWGNQEKQLYTDDPVNAAIETDANDVSALVITAIEESPGNYRSAKLTTQGLQSFRYGRIEARIKLPTAQGMWPAFWMLGENITQVDWPGCGEIDIMELVGSQPSTIHGSVHYTTAEKKHQGITLSSSLASGTFDEEYHDFRVDWTPESMIFSMDGNEYHTVAIGEDMKEFQRPFYLILNIAVGGSWPGDPDASTTFPQEMYVDYIRYYSKDDFTAPEAPALDIDEETIGSITPPSIAQFAFNSSLNQFPGIGLKAFGNGGEPEISLSDLVVEGDSALLFAYPGGNWGGGWFEMETPMDLSSYASGNLVFSILQSGPLADAEIKLEAVSNSAAIFLVNYTPVADANGYVQYKIPLADFTGLDLSAIRIPFALWNPVDAGGDYPVVDVLVDNIFWEN